MPPDRIPHAPSPPPAGFGLRLLNFVYGLVLVAIVVGFYLPIFIPALVIFLTVVRGYSPRDAVRVSNVMFGELTVALARPFVVIEKVGFDRIPYGRSCVYVANHRSYTDTFLMSQLGVRRVNIGVRSWPFGIPVMGWFMRMAGYMEMEADNIEGVLESCGRDAERGVSFLFFPEGHRSRDGHLQRLRSGAFLVADAHDLPVVVTCITGSENVAPIGRLMIKPGRIRIEVLGMVEPSEVSGPRRALRLRRRVESMLRAHLGEELEDDPALSPEDFEEGGCDDGSGQ